MPLPNAPQTQPSPPTPPGGGALGSLAQGPGGPGGSPMMSPGSGAGNQAAPLAKIKGMTTHLVNAMLAWPVGSKEFMAVQRAVESLAGLVGKAQVTNMV